MLRIQNVVWILFLLLLVGCGPGQAETAAQITAMAGEVLSTQAAQITKTAAVVQATQTAFVTATPTVAPTPTLGVGSTRISEVDGMTQMFVPGGEYRLGATDQEVEDIYQLCLENFQNKSCVKENYQDELPQHTVSLNGFWIDQTEVTNAMFSRFVDATGHQTTAEIQTFALIFNEDGEYQATKGANWIRPGGPESSLEGMENYPVVNVSWYDARAYCEWAGRRLPTEAEWEAAARGSDGLVFPWGNEPPDHLKGNLADVNFPWLAVRVDSIDDGWSNTAPVGLYPAGNSPFGVKDMVGNVSEWVYDGYAADTSALPGGQNPIYLERVEQRSARGGGFASRIVDGHSSNRFGYPVLTAMSSLGFRCASSDLVLPDPPPQENYLDEIVLLSKAYVFSADEGGLTDFLGSLIDGKGAHAVATHDDCSYLKITSPEFPDGGWILGPAIDSDLIFHGSCDSLEQVNFRPKNNTNFFSNPENYKKTEPRLVDETIKWVDVRKGIGVLKLTNLSAEDALFSILRLELKNNSPYGLYVRSGETGLLTDLIDGEYEIYVTTGQDFGFGRVGFQKYPAYMKLDQTIMIKASTGQTYWTVVIQPAEAGNVSGSPVSSDDFPR